MDPEAVSVPTAQRVLDAFHYTYPLIVLVVFLTAFTTRSIIKSKRAANNKAAKNGTTDTQPRVAGPGGKPLPPKKDKKDGKATEKGELDFSRPRKLLFIWLSFILCLTFVANAGNIFAHVYLERGWWCGQSAVFYIVGGFSVHALILVTLVDTVPSPTTAYLAAWISALASEVALLGASLSVYTHPHRERQLNALDMFGPLRKSMTDFEVAEVIIDVVRMFTIMALIVFYLAFVQARNAHKALEASEASESTPLLANGNGTTSQSAAAETSGVQNTPGGGSTPTADSVAEHHMNGTAHHGDAVSVAPTPYGTRPPTATQETAAPQQPKKKDAPAGWERPDKIPSRSWWEYLNGFTILFPYLWPSKDRWLQCLVVICLALVALQRVVNIGVVIEVGIITNYLAGEETGQVVFPLGHILLYIFFRMLQGGNGWLGAGRTILWIPVSQYSYREITIASFEHIHNLSLEFHLGKKTGEVISAMGKGASVNSFLENIIFQVVPMLADLGVAVAFLLIAFDAYFALVVAVVAFWYVYVTIRMAQWRSDMRRDMTNADRASDAIKNDSMTSYETIKYFGAEEYEFKRYRGAVEKFQTAEAKVTMSLNWMNLSQNAIFMVGLLVACMISAYQVTTGQQKVGNFTALLAIFAQLQGPLNFFGTFYRVIQNSMINAERMLELFKVQPTVVDGPTAKPMPTCEGDIQFTDVQFAYDQRKPAMNGLSFRTLPGTTTALVGESGGGKSTVFRLLFRFYNAESGRIQVDGRDVQDITIDGLRSHIGVVPQDTVLFNESLMYNLKYANQAATDEQVYAACKAASIHDRILSFPDGYNTKVGERGLRLSGGEKQRVAIARTIIKNPRIILLDEATAALDTETEQNIQEALDTLAKGRTMLVIAHRLSTIRNADQILVLNEGKVVERGTHDQLMEMNGKYKSMWRRQDRAAKAEEAASKLRSKADKLRKEINHEDGSPSASEDEAGEGSSRDVLVRQTETADRVAKQEQHAAEAGEHDAKVDLKEQEMLAQGVQAQLHPDQVRDFAMGAPSNGKGKATT